MRAHQEDHLLLNVALNVVDLNICQGTLQRLPYQCVSRALLPTLAVQPRLCVIAKRPGCLRRVAHAASRGHFSGAPTSERTDRSR